MWPSYLKRRKKFKFRFGFRSLFACLLLVVAFFSWRNYEISKADFEKNVAVEEIAKLGGHIEFSKTHRGKIDRVSIHSETLTPEFFEVLRSNACLLRELELINCTLVDCEAISRIDSLETLKIAHSDLREEDLRTLAEMRELKTLNFEGRGNLSTEGLQFLVSRPRKREIWLSEIHSGWMLDPHSKCKVHSIHTIDPWDINWDINWAE